MQSNMGVIGKCEFDNRSRLGRFAGGKCLFKRGGEHFGLEGECIQTKASDESVWQKDKLLQGEKRKHTSNKRTLNLFRVNRSNIPNRIIFAETKPEFQNSISVNDMVMSFQSDHVTSPISQLIAGQSAFLHYLSASPPV